MLITTTFFHLLVVAIILCNSGCSGASSMNQNNSLPLTPSSNDMKKQQDRPDAVRAALKREGSKLNLEDLAELKLGPAENEIRVWVGLGVLVPRCFVFKSGNDLREASYLTIQDSAARTEVLDPPHNGWPAFDRLLRAHKLTSPLELKPDAQYVADPDEEIIAIELKSGERYDLVYYSLGTQSEDGKSVVTLCQAIENEFTVRMGCKLN
jgi:hypothetical protein